jgi:hypothetical protein
MKSAQRNSLLQFESLWREARRVSNQERKLAR